MLALIGFIWFAALIVGVAVGAYSIGQTRARKSINRDEFLRGSVERSAIFRAGFHAGRNAVDL